jgi:hypothetical protein
MNKFWNTIYILACVLFCGFIITITLQLIQQKERRDNFILESRLDAAYSLGFWRGTRMTLKNYPPANKTIELSLIFKDFKPYSEVLKEKE